MREGPLSASDRLKWKLEGDDATAAGGAGGGAGGGGVAARGGSGEVRAGQMMLGPPFIRSVLQHSVLELRS